MAGYDIYTSPLFGLSSRLAKEHAVLGCTRPKPSAVTFGKWHLAVAVLSFIGSCFGPWQFLTHWGRATYICIGKLTIIGSDNGSSPGRRQAIIWTNAGIMLIGPLGINFSEILNKIHAFSLKKMHMKILSGKRRPFCLGLNVLTHWGRVTHICISRLGHHWSR